MVRTRPKAVFYHHRRTAGKRAFRIVVSKVYPRAMTSLMCGLDELVMDTSTRIESQVQRILVAFEDVSVYVRESVIRVLDQVCDVV